MEIINSIIALGEVTGFSPDFILALLCLFAHVYLVCQTVVFAASVFVIVWLVRRFLDRRRKD